MAKLEIEKRYLIDSYNIFTFLKKHKISYTVSDIEQFYLKATPKETLRYRKEGRRFLKNIKKGGGLVREELEFEVGKKEYYLAKTSNKNGVIKKKRVKFNINGCSFELDIFSGKLKGLSILETEFNSVEEAKRFIMPKPLKPFIIKEITNEAVYSNGALSRSMQIPLRDDSYISLKEIISSYKAYKPKFNLYISATEDTSYVFHNYLYKFYVALKLNLKKYAETFELKYLKVGIKSANRLKWLLFSFKNYLIDKNLIEALFNLNSFLQEAQKIAKLDRNFKLMLKYKPKFKVENQLLALKILIKIAQKLKHKKESFFECYSFKDLDRLEGLLNGIEAKKSLRLPFYYAKHKVLKKRLHFYKKAKNKEERFKEAKLLKTAAKFFKAKVKVKKFKKFKRVKRVESLTETIGRLGFKKDELADIIKVIKLNRVKL